MARTISDEELQLRRRARRRLIGAIVLVAAIVVILPMVLDSEPRPSQPITVQIPQPDSGGFAPKLAPLPPPPVGGKEAAPPPKPVAEPARVAAAPLPKEAPKEAPAAVKETPVAAKESPAPVAEAPTDTPRATAKPQPKAPRPAAQAKGGNHVIQVIALADAGKAKQMQQQIASAGIRSYTEVVKTAKGDVTRVRAGPFTSRSAAEKAREQLKTLGMNGNITTK